MDGETGMEAFQLRLWDGRIGRWLSPDPYHELHSPYVGMGNNPVNLVDPDGGRTNDPPTDGIPHYSDSTGEYFWNSLVNSYDRYDLPTTNIFNAGAMPLPTPEFSWRVIPGGGAAPTAAVMSATTVLTGVGVALLMSGDSRPKEDKPMYLYRNMKSNGSLPMLGESANTLG